MKIESKKDLKRYKLALFLILASFFFKGVFLVGVFPIFKGQDESRHYNTVQYLATDKLRVSQQESEIINEQVKKELSTYHYSDEIRETSVVVQNKKIRGNYYNKINFLQNSFDGKEEKIFKSKFHSRIQHVYPPDIARAPFGKDGFSLYHWGLSGVEKFLSPQNIFIRYSVLRIISVLLGIILLILAYNIFKIVRFTEKQSLILMAAISFQPKLVTYFTNINYDVLLIPLWTGFIFIGTLILKKGWNFYRILTLVVLLIGATMTKPSALPLLGLGVFLVVNTFYKNFRKCKIRKSKIIFIGLGGIIVGGICFKLLSKVGVTTIFSEVYIKMLPEYLGKSLPKIYGSSRDYWGAIGWSANSLVLFYVKIIWFIEWIAWICLGLWIVLSWVKKTKRVVNFSLPIYMALKNKCSINSNIKNIYIRVKKQLQKKSFSELNNQKKYFWFMFVAIIVLQIGIRVADWKIFTGVGNLSLGTPGRYWLPNIVPHFVLLALGLKVPAIIFSKNKTIQRKYFEGSLLGFLILMILYWTYEVVNIIIPRFYL